MNSTEPSTAALQSRAYDALNEYFTEHQDEVVEIEILPPAFQPPDSFFLQEGRNLGLPKKILAAAFLEARQRFFARVKEDPSSKDIFEATRVILLFDPEHLTACNHRKRHLHHQLQHSPQDLKTALRRELNFLNSILTSPLHRQSKSPTLWHHRSHLLAYILPSNTKLPSTAIPNITKFVIDELSAVLRSGECHPKNYYAFQYARRLFSTLQGSLNDCQPSVYSALIKECNTRVRDWCCRHSSDISGFSFLAWLLVKIEGFEERRLMVQPLIEYAVKVRLSNESLWVFVRTVAADGSLGRAGEVVVKLLRGYGGKDYGVLIGERIEQTLQWIEKYRIPAS